MIHKLSFLRARDGLSELEFAPYWQDVHAERFIRPLQRLRGYVQGIVDDGHYAVAEAPIDAVSMLWFDGVDGVTADMESAAFADVVIPDYKEFIDLRYFRTLVTDSQWLVQLGA